MGKGKIVCGMTPEQVLAKMDVGPDFTSNTGVRYIHRIANGSDVYFVSNGNESTTLSSCTFRVSGKQPQMWNPETGAIVPVRQYTEGKGTTTIPIRFEPSGSAFVVFGPKAATASQVVEVLRDGKSLNLEADANNTNNITMAFWVKPAATIDLPNEETRGVAGLSTSRNDVIFPPQGEIMFGVGQAGSGVSVGTNGVCVYEHSANYLVPILSYATPINDWTHIAVTYTNGKPSLYVNDKVVHEGLQSKMTVHCGISAEQHGSDFKGEFAGTRMFNKTLTMDEIAKLATSTKAAIDGEGTFDTVAVYNLPPIDIARGEAWSEGKYTLKRANGESDTISVGAIPKPVVIDGAWDVSFPPKTGAPSEIKLDRLISLDKNSDTGVKYFSGIATYRKTITIPKESIGKGRRVYLDLGRVEVMAQVKVNGKLLGILWKSPYRIDITSVAKPGENTLEIGVADLWINRQIGDESLPEDSDRNPGNDTLKSWPKWVLEGKSSPTGRISFTSWKLWSKSDPLVPSGLIGPVRVLFSQGIKVD